MVHDLLRALMALIRGEEIIEFRAFSSGQY